MYDILWKGKSSYWTSSMDDSYNMLPDDWSVSPTQFYEFGERHGWDQNAMYKDPDGYKWTQTYASPETQQRYLDYHRQKDEKQAEWDKREQELAAAEAEQRKRLQTYQNLAGNTGTVSGYQIENNPDVKSGTATTATQTAGDPTSIGSDKRKIRGRRVSSNLGI